MSANNIIVIVVIEVHFQEELDKAVKEKVLEKRSAVFEKTKLEVGKRAKFEDAVS